MTGKERYWSIHSDRLTKGDAKILNNWANWEATEKLLFPEDVFTPGSMINLYIGKANNARLLRHDIADSVPMSTKNFTAIIAMFAPVSVSMARDMWSTLNSCEHPREVAGEQKACATSIESMHEFAASALGTRDLHVSSSSLDVPREGISSPSRRYKMVAVRVARGGREANAVTCHSMSFPFAVFYCHAVNPTRIYEVTMQIEENNNVPAPILPKMVRALAVCHPDTSGFDPKLAYWKKHGAKPGDASVCHFLTRGDVLWAPNGATQGHGKPTTT
jgi:hypothetical protein